jgi:hypothetical protein|nr:hypothetical protein [Phenylobacterium sp.]
MKMLAGAAFAATLLIGCAAGSAQAQTAERTYENGPVWTVGYIETKPGMFDDYLAYLAGPWKALQEAGKKRGDILDYKVLAVDSPREHESDVILLVQYKNMGVFDRSLAELEKDNNAVFGSNPASNKAAVKREDIRVLHGGVTARELKFIK